MLQNPNRLACSYQKGHRRARSIRLKISFEVLSALQDAAEHRTPLAAMLVIDMTGTIETLECSVVSLCESSTFCIRSEMNEGAISGSCGVLTGFQCLSKLAVSGCVVSIHSGGLGFGMYKYVQRRSSESILAPLF